MNYDDAEDNVGKSASYDDARQIELEAGVKLAKTFVTDESIANVYVKPSVVQTIVDGDEVSITGLSDVEALDDATLGRIEISGRYGFTTNLSAYGWANYTFGSDYDATTFGLGLPFGLNHAFNKRRCYTQRKPPLGGFLLLSPSPDAWRPPLPSRERVF